MAGMHVKVVHTCGDGRTRRLDRVNFAVGVARPSLSMSVVSAPRPGAVRYESHTERTPDDGWKIRWTCPTGTCALDVAVSGARLDQLLIEWGNAQVTSVELADIATMLSKQ